MLVYAQDRERAIVAYPENNGKREPHHARGDRGHGAQCTAKDEDDGGESKEGGPRRSKEGEDHSVSFRW